ILAQRKFCQFVSPMCKTLISKAPIIWSPGFHGSSFFPNVDQRLYLFHLKRADLKTNLERLELTRKINWKSDNLGLHQRSSDEEMIKLFESYTRYSVTDDFSFSQEISEFISETKLDSKGIYSCKDIRGKRMVTIPERFVGIL
ncbi:hypothetical protein V5F77_28555, partial [Xanthobacter sp. DSM 24535]|uniref:hypothetical protein n=1 Tax=Roseixanthobacter psychrophilus TaxID=3119917 RepID=UPI00372CB0BF